MANLKCLICGMDINEKNMNFNSETFLAENKLGAIIYCPFCGVSEEYLIEDGEKYTIAELDEKTLKILDHAAKLEVFNGDFYKKASKLAKDEKNKKIFEALSRIEYMHARVHCGLAQKDLPSIKEMNYDNYNSDEVLFGEAKKREKHAVAFYNKYYNEVSGDLIRKIFDALIKVEKEHIELISI